MSAFSQSEFIALLQMHGLEPKARGDWVVVAGQYPAVRVQTAGSALYIEVRLDETRGFQEVYAQGNGLDLFCDGTLHVLLSAFWSRHNPQFVTQQLIRNGDVSAQLYIGRYLREIETGERPAVPYGLFGAVEAFIRDRAMSEPYHWLSTAIVVDEDGAFADIRLDGIRQPALETTVAALDWRFDGRTYRLRHSVAVLKA